MKITFECEWKEGLPLGFLKREREHGWTLRAGKLELALCEPVAVSVKSENCPNCGRLHCDSESPRKIAAYTIHKKLGEFDDYSTAKRAIEKYFGARL